MVPRIALIGYNFKKSLSSSLSGDISGDVLLGGVAPFTKALQELHCRFAVFLLLKG